MPRLRQEIASQLACHGVHPREESSLDQVRTFVRDLYNHELRQQRDRVRAGTLEKADLVEEVHRLRRKYWVLSVPISQWTIDVPETR